MTENELLEQLNDEINYWRGAVDSERLVKLVDAALDKILDLRKRLDEACGDAA